MKIKGEYILSRRSIVRMIATITAALMSLYAVATAHAESAPPSRPDSSRTSRQDRRTGFGPPAVFFHPQRYLSYHFPYHLPYHL